MRNVVPVALTAGILFACSSGTPVDMDALKAHRFQLAHGGQAGWSDLAGPRATALITLDPECPFCQGYAPMIDSLSRMYAAKDVRFVGLYPAGFIARDSVVSFAARSGFGFPQVMDDDCTIANALRARVTPEVFVLDATDKLRYRGALDDRAVRAGKHKVRATRHHLVAAIDALLVGSAMPEGVPAVGCIVECGASGTE